MSSKKGFWASIPSVKCPECDKWYQHRTFMIHHMTTVHGHSWDEAKKIVDATGIYCPEMYRRK